MKVKFKKIAMIHQFSESFVRNQEASKFPLLTEKMVALEEKMKYANQEQILERDALIMNYAEKDSSRALIYSDMPHSKYPYKYTPENLIALEKALFKQANEAAEKEYEIPVQESEWIGKGNTSVIPEFFYPLIIDLYKGLIICPCVVKLDGTINRSEEQTKRINDNFNPAAKKEMAKA